MKFICLSTILFLWIFIAEGFSLKSKTEINNEVSETVINTWPFTAATKEAYRVLTNGSGTALDAVEAGCSVCERIRCDGSVGYGSNPDEEGETTLDAMIMDGSNQEVGAVGCLRRVKNAIGVARSVMEHSEHTLIVGDLARKFAVEMGFKEEDLTTNHSRKMWQDWKNKNCQPNYRMNVTPDPRKNCGPYHSQSSRQQYPNFTLQKSSTFNHGYVTPKSHDTIGMLAIDSNGQMAAGTTTNGANHKIPGRVGDSPIMGAGSYVISDVGGAAATGDGDKMMRFLPSFYAVELLRQGKSASKAASEAIKRISTVYPSFQGALIVLAKSGKHGAACNGWQKFQYSVMKKNMSDVRVITILCKKYAKKTSK